MGDSERVLEAWIEFVTKDYEKVLAQISSIEAALDKTNTKATVKVKPDMSAFRREMSEIDAWTGKAKTVKIGVDASAARAELAQLQNDVNRLLGGAASVPSAVAHLGLIAGKPVVTPGGDVGAALGMRSVQHAANFGLPGGKPVVTPGGDVGAALGMQSQSHAPNFGLPGGPAVVTPGGDVDAALGNRIPPDRTIDYTGGLVSPGVAAASAQYAEHQRAQAAAQQYHSPIRSGDPMDMFAFGVSLRRVVATAMSQAFGDSKVGQAAAGIGGILAGSVLLRLGWMIGNLIIGAPEAIGQAVADYRTKATPGYLGGEAASAATGALRQEYGFLRTPQGRSMNEVLSEMALAVQLSGSGSENPITKASKQRSIQEMLALPTAAGFITNSSDIATALALGESGVPGGRDIAKAVIGRIPAVRAMLMEGIRKNTNTPGWLINKMTDVGLDTPESMIAKNPITYDQAKQALTNLSYDQRVQRNRTAQRGEFRWSDTGFMSQLNLDPTSQAYHKEEAYAKAALEWQRYQANPSYRTPGRYVTPPMGVGYRIPDKVPENAADVAKRLGIDPQRAAEINAIAAVGGSKSTLGQQADLNLKMPTSGQLYEFTSLSGLAERMQMMASETSDIQEKQLDEIKKTNTLLDQRLPKQEKPQLPVMEGIEG